MQDTVHWVGCVHTVDWVQSVRWVQIGSVWFLQQEQGDAHRMENSCLVGCLVLMNQLGVSQVTGTSSELKEAF